MITVYVWLPNWRKKNYGGHTSMLVSGLTYISWWPADDRKLGNRSPIRNRKYSGDIVAEGGKPDWSIQLNGLDEQSILDWWEKFGLTKGNTWQGIPYLGEPDELLAGPLPPYNVIEQNCSTVVASGLKQGGGDKYANSYDSWSVIWRPRTVLHFALSIQKGLG